MAVRTEEDALDKLGFDPRPAPRGAVRRDREVFLARVEVVELERCDRFGPAAAATGSTHRRDRALLCLLAEPHHRVAAIGLRLRVARTVTVSAHEDAAVGFSARAVDAPEEATEGERLVTSVAVVELQRPDVAAVTAVLAPTTSLGDEPLLDLNPTSTAVPDPRLQAAHPRCDKRSPRAVVCAERRAGGAERPTAEDADFSIYNHATWDHNPASSADLHLTKIGTPLRADPAPRGGLEPPTWRLLVPPGFPGTWTISSPSPSPVLGAGCIVSEPSRGVSSGSAADCHGAYAL